MLATIPVPEFAIGDRVHSVAFVDCFGESVEATHDLSVTDRRLIMPSMLNTPAPTPPYWRYTAESTTGPVWLIEGAGRFFEAASNREAVPA